MKRKILFPILLFIVPFIVSSQSTAKEWYSKGVELKGKKDYEEASEDGKYFRAEDLLAVMARNVIPEGSTP